MSKSSTYILIILLSILIIVLAFIMAYGIKYNGFKNKKAELVLSEKYAFDDINKINVKTKSSDIIFKESEDENVYVDIYSANEEDVSSTLENGALNVVSKSKFNFCFFCFRSGSQRVEIRLPKSYSGSIKTNARSGDLIIPSLKDATLNASAKSGDIEISNIKKATITLTSGDIEIKNIETANIKTTSGDIEIDNVFKKVDIKVTSGDVDIDDFEIKANSSIKATSGDIKINNVTDAFINTSVKSGDVKVNGSERTAEYELNINVTSGDIKVN